MIDVCNKASFVPYKCFIANPYPIASVSFRYPVGFKAEESDINKRVRLKIHPDVILFALFNFNLVGNLVLINYLKEEQRKRDAANFSDSFLVENVYTLLPCHFATLPLCCPATLLPCHSAALPPCHPGSMAQ